MDIGDMGNSVRIQDFWEFIVEISKTILAKEDDFVVQVILVSN